MIPVLGVPVLNRPDLLARMLASVDVEVGQTVIVDNGGVVPADTDAWVIDLPANIGVAASWNLVIKCHPLADWWALVNDDIEFAPGDLARLAAVMESGAPLATLDGFAAFGISATCVERVGWFDENYHPAYVEDCDYEYRCTLAGIAIVELPSGLRHDRSSTIAEPRYGAANARTYPANVRYHIAKWGGAPRGGERFTSPFDRGNSVADWQPDLRILRDNAWPRDGSD